MGHTDHECLARLSWEEFLESEAAEAQVTTAAGPLAEASLMHHDILVAQSVAKDFHEMTLLPRLGTLYQSQEYEGSSGESADSELRDHGLASAPGQQNKENMSPSITTSVQVRDGAEGYRVSGPGLCSVDHRLRMLASSLEAVEARCEILSVRADDAEQKAAWYSQQIYDQESIEQGLRTEVSRLQGTIEAQQLASNVAEDTLRDMLAHERRRSERLARERDAALHSRADAVIELGETAEDIEAMQSMLAGCASYCTELESRLEEMANASEAPAAFNVQHVEQAIHEAVAATRQMPEAARKKEIHKLLLRWHPDKNSILKDFASEVTKIINEAASQLSTDIGGDSAEAP